MLETILALDTDLLLWIHQHLHNQILDPVMVLMRNKWTWIPVYIFLLSFVLFNFRMKGLLWVLMFILTISLCDFMSTKLLKERVMRIRPCHTELVTDRLDLLVSCGGRYGFVSSHAANHFGMAAFIVFTLGRMMRRIRWPVILWAALIAFAQVYVGVHYPLDVIAGGLLGWLIGWGIAWYYRKRLKNLSIEQRARGIEQRA